MKNAPSPLLILASILVSAVDARSATHSFDASTGRIAVDREAYLSKHQLAVSGAITDSSRALTVGNGRVGAMVWNRNGISMQITGVDASPHTAFSAGRVNFNTSPSLDDGGAKVEQMLSLHDGNLTLRYADGRVVTIFGVPNSEILGIHVEDSRSGLQSATLNLGMWDPATQMSTRSYGAGFNSMMGDVPDVNTWKAVSTLVETSVAGISRGQTDANHFGYTLAASVEGTAFTTSRTDGRNVRLSIAPAKRYTIYVVCASRLNAPDWNSVEQAKSALASAVSSGYAANLAASLEWWHAFWERSFVQFSSTAQDADYLESYYHLATYMIGCGSYAKFPMHFINGVSRYDMDNDVHWSGAYWWWNMRNVYSGQLAANRLDAFEPLLDMYRQAVPKLTAATKSRFSVDGLWVPETMRWDGDARWTTSSDYTKGVMTTAAEVALAAFDRFRYSGDSTYLEDKAYPLMKEAAKFLQARLSFDAGKGLYSIASSHSHETYWNVPNSFVDLVAIRSLFPRCIAVSQALGTDSDLRAKWQDVLAKLAPLKTETVNGQIRWLPHDPPIAGTHNYENVTCEAAWPYGTVGIGSSDLAVAVQSYRTRPFAYAEIWSPDAIQAARLGLGDDAFTDMKRMQTKHQDRPNGLTSNSNGVFDFVGLILPSLNESMLQSHNDTIRVFPAMPAASGLVARFTLLATGGFLVSSEKEADEIKYVGLRSQRGRRAVVFNPWGTSPIQVRSLPANEVVATSSSTAITFPTVEGGTYVVERTSAPFSGYTFSRLSGSPNWSAKQLVHAGRTSTLGSGKVTTITSIQPRTPLAARPALAANWKNGTLSLQGMESGTLTLLHLDGRTIASTTAKDGRSRTPHLTPGTYLIHDPTTSRSARFLVLP